jgi:tetratricopeptide (TPR) repeat protein
LPGLVPLLCRPPARHFRFVLVDSRTGRTDSAGICTTLLPRKLVVVFTPNRQSLEGVQALVTRATTYRRSHEDEQRPLLVYPLPSRIEMGDSAQRAQWRRGDERQRILGYQPSFEELIRDCYGMRRCRWKAISTRCSCSRPAPSPTASRWRCGSIRAATVFADAHLRSLPGLAGARLFPVAVHREIHLLASISAARRALDEGGGGARAMPQSLARDLNLLGELYRREGKLRQALALLEEGWPCASAASARIIPDTLASKLNLAAALRQQGKLEEAQFLEECVIEARERLLGRTFRHPGRAQQPGLTLGQQGRLAEALAMQDAVIDTDMRLLGAEHLLTLSAKAARAELLLMRGDAEHARSVQEQVLAARKRLLGAEHADTLRSKTALAHTLLQMQELEAARSLLEAVLHAHLRRLGPDHPETSKAREQLMDVHMQLGLPAGEPPVAHELHQNAAMDDYGDALVRPPGRGRGQNQGASLWARSADELMALDGYLSAPRPPQR